MNYSLLLKIFVTAALLGFTASVITLWAIRSSLAGVVHVAHRTAGSLTYTRLPLPRK
ncbi:MAG: hypothetical protein BMS9Abin06_0918 [Gammaproteobacteria bacterium]|nr:MAG: hypothetical protein BMS9Abin06_0918 [Gammaproteobacteria bacterium]